MSKDDERLMVHDYDGIREYDNPLPGWWSWTFVVCIAFAGAYWYWYHAGGGGTSELAEYAAVHSVYAAHQEEMRKAEEKEVSEAVLAKLAKDPEALAIGKGVFLTRCFACHTVSGKGLVGPNLTDDFQLHGSTRMDLFNTVKTGVPAKGMISWAPILKIGEMKAVVAFVSTLRGTNVPEGKVAEGAKVGGFSD